MYTVYFHHIVIVFDKLSEYGEKILYTYVYHIVGCLGNCEALDEITDLVHQMLSVCAPLGAVRSYQKQTTALLNEFQFFCKKNFSGLHTGQFLVIDYSFFSCPSAEKKFK